MEICHTCLSRGRKLFPLKRIEGYFTETKMVNTKCNEYMVGNICWECQHIMAKFAKFKKQVMRAQELLKMHKLGELTSLSSLYVKTTQYFDTEYHYIHDPLTNSDIITKTEEETIKQESIHGEVDFDDDHKPEMTDIYVEALENKSITKVNKRGKIVNKIENSKVIKQESIDDEVDFDGNGDHKPEISQKNGEGTSLKDKQQEITEIFVETLEKKSITKVKKREKNVNRLENSNELLEKFITVVYTEEEVLKKREEKRSQPNFKKIPFKCDLCVLGFNKKDTYDDHLEKKHCESIGPLMCEVCHVRFASENAVSRHRSQHYVTYRCKFCPYRTSHKWAAVNHSRVKHGDDSSGNVHCNHCDLVASTPEDLAEHKQTKHSLHCNVCGEKFKGRNTLRTHKIRIHGSKREFSCDICSKSFNTSSRLESHVARHSAALATRLSYCTHCRVQYNSVHVYRNHLRNSAHHASATYPCPECNKRFASKVYWKKHYNFYHLHKSKYKCEVCNKLFISNWRLKTHKQKHHGLSRSRDHACKTCEKKFYTTSTLRAHEQTHSEHRSYMCEDCGDTFKQRPALYTHHRLVHGVKKNT